MCRIYYVPRHRHLSGNVDLLGLDHLYSHEDLRANFDLSRQSDLQRLDHLQGASHVQDFAHMHRKWPDLSGYGQLRLSYLFANRDMRSTLLMLGSGDVRRTSQLRRQPDMRKCFVQCHRRDLCGSGFLPWRSDLPRNRDLRHEHMPRRCNL